MHSIHDIDILLKGYFKGFDCSYEYEYINNKKNASKDYTIIINNLPLYLTVCNNKISTSDDIDATTLNMIINYDNFIGDFDNLIKRAYKELYRYISRNRSILNILN